ncbi:MAG: hypothetical protein IKF96_00450, partial [Eggerthellaceae bacterium]|nr:hypothetical protein [Eggerthellaceae bacterium]
VFGNKKEIEEYKAIREKGEPLHPITIAENADDLNGEWGAELDAKAEEEFLKIPIDDTGSMWYGVLGFLLPLIGLIVMPILKRKKYFRNYRICRKGTIAGWILIGALVAIFLIMLLLVLR